MNIRKNEYGYYEVTDKPSDAELSDYYSSKYYQFGDVGYSNQYDREELRFIDNKLKQKYELIKPYLDGDTHHSLLDVGCGEGFTLPFFASRGWDVLGIDFSEHAINQHHPDWTSHFRAGDFRSIVRDLAAEGRSFTVLWLDNVLEHARDPFQLLVDCFKLTVPGGLILIDVPNDFSPLQDEAQKLGLIDREFWVALPDHLSYFNPTGLRNLADAAGWQHCRTIADFPIDFNLFHSLGNYIMEKATGKAAHQQRIQLENLLTKISVEKTLSLYEALSELGLGRSINSVFRKPVL